jgi:hypothetical protein
MKSSIARFVIVFSLVLIATGCHSKNGPVDVEGVVLLDNEPVAEATVLFIPEGGTGQPAHGMTDENGKFRLSTFQENDGALAGAYKVTVTKSVPPPQPPEAEPGDSRSIMAHFKAIKQHKQEKSPLPAVYANEKTTPFHYSVPVQGKLILELKAPQKK